MREWEIEFKEYLKRLNLSAKEFKSELCLPKLKDVCRILPLRNIKEIQSLIPISSEMLLYLVRRIKTLNGLEPFKNAEIKMGRIGPRHLKIGQKFAYRENYQKLMEDVPNIFERFCVGCGGLADLAAYFVFGDDENGVPSLACYIPPFVEQHGENLIIMDGIHRNYIAMQSGATPHVIFIENVEIPFPCGPKDWSNLKVIPLAEKPKDINERYFDLKKDLFRDLKYLGIDG